MTKGLKITAAGAALILGVGSGALAQGQANNAKATLIGFEENPSISTRGTGTLDLSIDDTAKEIAFVLTYANLEGVAPLVTDGIVTAAHIHISRPSFNGGVAAFLCGGGGRPACPISGTVTGVITAADVIGPATQGVDPGEPTAFEEFVASIRAGYTYVNVHTTRWTSGEIRGQIK